MFYKHNILKQYTIHWEYYFCITRWTPLGNSIDCRLYVVRCSTEAACTKMLVDKMATRATPRTGYCLPRMLHKLLLILITIRLRLINYTGIKDYFLIEWKYYFIIPFYSDLLFIIIQLNTFVLKVSICHFFWWFRKQVCFFEV